jgi:thiamine phosphate synthase YjbQ (UPF0047 family)
MVQQATFSLRQRSRGFHLITDEIKDCLREAGITLPKAGLLNLFIKHTKFLVKVNYTTKKKLDLFGTMLITVI